MNAKVKALEILGQSNVPASLIVEALEIIKNNASGVETSKKIADLFNSRMPSEVNSLANRWVYQAIVYTTDANYEALADNIENIAERYFALAVAGDLVKDFEADFKEKLRFDFHVGQNMTLIATEGAEDTIKWAHHLSNIIGMTEFGFNNNADLLQQIVKSVEQIDAVFADEVKTLESEGSVKVSEGYVSVRRKGVIHEGEESAFVLAIGESAVHTYNLHKPV